MPCWTGNPPSSKNSIRSWHNQTEIDRDMPQRMSLFFARGRKTGDRSPVSRRKKGNQSGRDQEKMEELSGIGMGGRLSGRIMPFLWLHGEGEALIREGMARIFDSGIGAVCVESRPHPDFLGDGWWRDLDVVLDEAKKRRMKVLQHS